MSTSANRGLATPRGLRWHPWLAALLGALCFANSIGNGLTYDDVPLVRDNPAVRSITDFRNIWLSDWWRPFAEADPQHLDLRRDRLYRPLTVFSFALQYQFHGPAPLGYHAVNVLLHALACALVWKFVQMLWGDALISLITALLFAVHPLHAEAVANIVGRAEVLAAIFILLGLIVLLKSATPGMARTATAALLFFLGLLSKETAISYPAVALLALHALRSRAGADGLAGFSRKSLGWWLVRAAVLLIPVAIYLPLRYFALEHHFIRDGDPSPVFNPVVLATGASRLTMALVILGHYARLLIIPAQLAVDYGLKTTDPDRFDPLSIAGAIAALVLIVALWGYRRRTGPWRQVAVAAAIFLASYALISNTVLLIGVVLAERLMYWPSVPLIMFVAAGVAALWRSQCRPGGPLHNVRGFLRAAGVAMLLALGVRTVFRSFDWQSNLLLFHEDVQVWPDNVIANRNYSRELVYIARTVPELRDVALRDALRHSLHAIEISPSDPDALLGAANAYNESGDREKAEWYANAVLMYMPADPYARRLVATMLLPHAAAEVADLERQVAAEPANVEWRIRLGRRLHDLARTRDALEQAKEAVRLAPENVEALRLLGEMQALAADAPAAVAAFERLVKGSPHDWQALTNLATLIGASDPPRSLDYARRAHDAAPQEYETNLNLAEALALNDRLADALQRFRLMDQGLQADDPRKAHVRQRISDIETRRE